MHGILLLHLLLLVPQGMFLNQAKGASALGAGAADEAHDDVRWGLRGLCVFSGLMRVCVPSNLVAVD